jgi:hypothetical protein
VSEKTKSQSPPNLEGLRKAGSGKTTPKEPISFEHLGGKRIHDGAVAVRPEKPIDFSHNGGKRVDQHQPTPPEEPKGDKS